MLVSCLTSLVIFNEFRTLFKTLIFFGCSDLSALSYSSLYCSNHVTNCGSYGHSVCISYAQWAKEKCPLYCGYCLGTTYIYWSDKNIFNQFLKYQTLSLQYVSSVFISRSILWERCLILNQFAPIINIFVYKGRSKTGN